LAVEVVLEELVEQWAGVAEGGLPVVELAYLVQEIVERAKAVTVVVVGRQVGQVALSESAVEAVAVVAQRLAELWWVAAVVEVWVEQVAVVFAAKPLRLGCRWLRPIGCPVERPVLPRELCRQPSSWSALQSTLQFLP